MIFVERQREGGRPVEASPRRRSPPTTEPSDDGDGRDVEISAGPLSMARGEPSDITVILASCADGGGVGFSRRLDEKDAITRTTSEGDALHQKKPGITASVGCVRNESGALHDDEAEQSLGLIRESRTPYQPWPIVEKGSGGRQAGQSGDVGDAESRAGFTR